MKRKEFIIKSSAASMFFALSPYSIIAKDNPGAWKILQYLIPILIDKGVEFLFDSFSNKGKRADEVVNESIKYIGASNYSVSPRVNYHYNNIVQPKIGTSKLNGVGIDGDDSDFRAILNDYGARSTTPMFVNSDLNTFEKDIWVAFCDTGKKQVTEDGRIYVQAVDGRKEDWKEMFFVESNLNYLLMEPKYYCYGLPIENPQYHKIEQSTIRDIKAKIGKESNAKYYYSQRFFYKGENDCSGEANTTSIIWGDYDAAYREYKGLNPINPCGDPTIECVQGHATRPKPSIR